MKKWLAGAGLIALCAACCTLPFTLVGVLGVIGLSVKSWLFGGILLLSAFSMYLYSRNSKPHACHMDCGCKND